MNIWLLGAGALAILLVALVLVSLATVASFRCLVGVFRQDRQKRMRFALGAAAVVGFIGLFVVAAAGFVGIGKLLTSG